MPSLRSQQKNNNFIDPFKEALGYSYKLLSIRSRSEKEIRDALNKKSFGHDIIDTIINKLKLNGLIDDKSFALKFARSKISIKGFGPYRIRFDLRRLGIDPDNIEEALRHIEGEFDSSLKVLVKKKLRTLNNLDPGKVRTRLFRFLASKGYSVDAINNVFSEIKLNE